MWLSSKMTAYEAKMGKKSLTPFTGGCGFFLQAKFSTYSLRSQGDNNSNVVFQENLFQFQLLYKCFRDYFWSLGSLTDLWLHKNPDICPIHITFQQRIIKHTCENGELFLEPSASQSINLAFMKSTKMFGIVLWSAHFHIFEETPTHLE